MTIRWHIVVRVLAERLIPALAGALLALLSDAAVFDRQGRAAALQVLDALSESSSNSRAQSSVGDSL